MINVLSLFDGISCGQVAIERAGIKVDKYYASEIDKYAIDVTHKNYPNTIQIGDVTALDFSKFTGEIQLLIGGSPCQDLSISNKTNGERKGLFGQKSRLFWRYVDALKIVKPKYFLLENVASMKKSDKEVITEILGVEPIKINSAKVSALIRERLYWTNIPDIQQPIDKGILFIDIMQRNLQDEKMYLSAKMIECLERHKQNQNLKGNTFGYRKINENTDKVRSLKANYWKIQGDSDFVEDINGIRKLSPLECERLQTLPDNYTDCLSNTRRYETVGNGWTVDVITHILSSLESRIVSKQDCYEVAI